MQRGMAYADAKKQGAVIGLRFHHSGKLLDRCSSLVSGDPGDEQANRKRLSLKPTKVPADVKLWQKFATSWLTRNNRAP